MVTQHEHNRSRTLAGALLLTGVFLVLLLEGVHADPTGASILTNSTAGTPTVTPGNMTNARGTITTMTLNAVQQDQNWKAYVGNITGRLSLDDASGYTIYDWTLLTAISGEIYVSRYNTLTFSNVTCATNNNITIDHPLYNMTNSQSDNINNTFNWTVHSAFQVGTQSISANSCPSTATYVNDTAQNMSATPSFQELILQDASYRLIFVGLIDDDDLAYNLQTYDFQLIVPESDTNATSTTYYFWTEISG